MTGKKSFCKKLLLAVISYKTSPTVSSRRRRQSPTDSQERPLGTGPRWHRGMRYDFRFGWPFLFGVSYYCSRQLLFGVSLKEFAIMIVNNFVKSNDSEEKKKSLVEL